MLWLGLIGAVSAQTLDSREALLDAMLLHARGQVAQAAGAYADLSRRLSDTDPTLSESLYWLGLAEWEVGEVEEARRALLDGVRTGDCPRCRELLERIELDAASIRTLPSSITFSAGNRTVFHPWKVQQLGAIRVDVGPSGDQALAWSTLAGPGEPDLLVFGLDAEGPPVSVGFDVWSTGLDALLDVVATDDVGRRFGLPSPAPVPRGVPKRIWVPLGNLVAVEPTAGGRSEAVDPTRIVSLAIVDRTGQRFTGPNELWIDDVEVR